MYGNGCIFELNQKNPDKKFYSVGHRQFCPNMKMITLDKVVKSLEENITKVELDKELSENAEKPLDKMLELAE